MILSSARCSIHGSAQFGAGLLLCSRDNRRKELFMSAKDKEKLNMAGTIVSLLKGDTIVIDPDEFRRRADIKNKEFYEVEKDTERKEEKKVPGLTDAEMLCCDIAIHIAHYLINSDRCAQSGKDRQVNTNEQKGFHMADKNDITFEIMEHIGVIDEISNRDEKWTKEVNVVAWNGGKPKIDVRDWNSSHDRMSRGITLTEDQAMKMTKALVDRFRARANQEHSTPMMDDYTR